MLGTPYCVWTEEYPSEKEVEFDLSRDALFCMRDDAGNIAGVISIDDDPNVECLTCWSETMVPSAEVSRVGVCQEFQNQGIAGKLLKGVMEELKKRGYQAVHLLVAKDNVKALRSYDKLNFENVGECELWGHMYWCYEKAL
ncbi:MAG: GNAT family N-acetyltransferase [Blautia massiliensis (ex Durand et al. 2017)]